MPQVLDKVDISAYYSGHILIIVTPLWHIKKLVVLPRMAVIPTVNVLA